MSGLFGTVWGIMLRSHRSGKEQLFRGGAGGTGEKRKARESRRWAPFPAEGRNPLRRLEYFIQNPKFEREGEEEFGLKEKRKR